MLASSPFYTSVTFWTIAGVIVGIVSVAAILVTWTIGTPRRVLLYSMPVATSLLSRRIGGQKNKDLQLRYLGNDLTDPYTVVLRVESKSRKDIRSTDFDQGKPIIFDLNAPIVAIVGSSNQLEVPTENIVIEDSAVKIAPVLIRRGIVLRLSLLTEGNPHVTADSPLVDTEVRERDLKPPKWLLIPLAVLSIAMLVFPAVTIIRVHHPSHALLIGVAVLTLCIGGIFVESIRLTADILRGNLTRRGV